MAESTSISIPNYPQPKSANVPVKVDPVTRSIAREDAFMKPGSLGNGSMKPNTRTRIRLSNEPKKGRPRKHPRDKRDVLFY